MSTTPSKLTIRRSSERGHANHGWLDSYHTFSFAGYHDPAHMGFRSLRVINQDTRRTRRGFPDPSAPRHGNFQLCRLRRDRPQGQHGQWAASFCPAQIQLMSAGSGVTHSEFNPSKTEPLHLLQIWILPATRGLAPSYTEWHPSPDSDDQAKALVISPDGREGSATIHQDADVYRIRLKAGETVSHDLPSGRGLWLQVMGAHQHRRDLPAGG